MKRIISLLLVCALLAMGGCVALAEDAVTPQDVIDAINAQICTEEMFNNCDVHIVDAGGNPLEIVANPNSGALNMTITDAEGEFTEGEGAVKFTKKRDARCDVPIFLRTTDTYYIEAYKSFEFDLYLSEGITIKPGENPFANVKFQSARSNSLDENTVYTLRWADQFEACKVGEWNRISLPIGDPGELDPVCQITIRFFDLFDGNAGEYIIYDNAYFVFEDEEYVPTLADRDAIMAIQAKYDSLSDEDKAQVTNADQLADWVEKLNQLAEAPEQVNAMIAALPAAEEVTLEDEQAIQAARAAYNALSLSQRSLVTDLAKLMACEEALEALKGSDPGPGPQPGNVRYGDVNNDQAIDAKDALLVLKAAVGKETITDAQKKAADVNADQAIDAKDALDILKFAVKKLDQFKAETMK